VNTLLEATPGTHHHPAHHRADGAGGLHRAEEQAILVRARQDHRCHYCVANAGEQVSGEKDELQPQQAGARKDIAEAEQRLFEQAAARFPAFLGDARRRDMHDEQRSHREGKGDNIQQQDALELDERQQRARQQWRHNARTGFYQRHQPVGASQLFPGHHGGDGRRVGRPLKGATDSVEHRRDVEVPEFQAAEEDEHEDAASGHHRRQV